jgi:hypothetical protein
LRAEIKALELRILRRQRVDLRLEPMHRRFPLIAICARLRTPFNAS